MNITKENFIEQFIANAIAQGEAYDAIITDKWKEAKKENEKLVKHSIKYKDFLANNIEFAKKTLDELIKYDNFYVMKSVSFMLWEFNYRLSDCYKIFEKIINNKAKEHQPTVIAAESMLLAIKENRLKRHREFPKID